LLCATFPLGVYDLEALKRAAYRLSARAAVEIVVSETEVSCVLHPLRPLDTGTGEQLLNEFRVEVLDQDLRGSIARETETIRTAVLAYAFSRSGLQGE
jgi:His-Xaa-Ser system protein HxsD